MARGLHIGASHFAALDAHVQAVEQAAYEAANIATSHVEQSVIQRANASVAWRPLLEHIWMESQDGRLVLGVEPEFESQAVAAEYGNETQRPSPLMRTIGTAARGAAAEAERYLQSKMMGF